MKKIFVTLVLMLMLVFSLSAQIVEKTFFFDNPQFEQYQGYEQISLDCYVGERQSEYVQIADEGCPNLPWYSVSLLLPQNTESRDIEFEFSDFVEIEGSHLLYPYQAPRPLSLKEDMPFVVNENIYLSDDEYPTRYSSDVTTQYLNGYSFAFSGFTPVRYIPSTGKLSYAQTVKVRVSCAASRNDKGKMLKTTDENKSRVQRLAHNPEMSEDYEQRGQRGIGGYELLVVTPSEWVSHFDEYKAFYDARGLRTKIVPLEDIYTSSEGRDEQEQIRAFISHEYENEDIMMVLLGGDVKLVPYRGLYCYVNHDYEDYGIPADMYYVCLDGTWNNDNDTLWGEEGEEDFLPELAIARLPFNNEEQFNNIMHKTMTYQTAPVLGEFNDIVFGAEHLGEGYYGNEDLELLIGEHDDDDYTTIGIPKNYKFHRYYAKPDRDWNANEFRSKINEVGGGYVYHVGHANTDYVAGWYLSDINDKSFAKLNGADHNYSFFHSHGCVCGDFSSACILEKFVTLPNGFVAVTGNSRYGWYVPWSDGPARHLNRELVDSYFHDRRQYIGTAFMEMKIMTAPFVNVYGQENSHFRWSIYCINVLGDVAVSPWLDEPFIPEIDYDVALIKGTTSTTVYVDKDSEPQSNFRCSLFYKDQLLAFGTTNNNGKAVLQFSEPLDIQDTLKLIVTGPNAWCQTLNVYGIDKDSNYIFADDIVINDDDNGKLDYNEDVTLNIKFINKGADNAENIIATLSTTSDDLVEITDNEILIPSINANSTKTVNDAFSIKVKDNVKDNSYAYFTMTCADGEKVYNHDFQCKILAPDLTIVKVNYDDSNGDSDGVVDVGESVQVQISSSNKGHCACDDIVIKAVSNNDDIVFNNNEKKISRLEAGANVITTFTFVTDDDTPKGSIVDIDVTLSSGFYEDKQTIRFVVGSVEDGFETGDFSSHNWKNDEMYPWVITDEYANRGVYSAQSAIIDDDEVSTLSIDVETITDGVISFYLKTSTEEEWDYLTFFVDEEMMESWSGENDWQRVKYPIEAGSHTLKWSYDKSKNDSAGEDRCWIDDIVFPINTHVLNIESSVEKKEILIYPNPVDDFFKLEGDNIHNVEIYNIMGAKIMSHDVSFSNAIDVANLSSGLYLVRVLDEDNNVVVKKIIKK